MFDKISSKELEQGLLASILIESGSNYPLVGYITEEDFLNQKHKQIWQAFEDECFDPISINNKFAGSGEYVVELLESIPSSNNLEQYAEQLREKTKQRLLSKKLKYFSEEISKHDVSSDLIVSDLSQELDYINGLTKTRIKNKKDVLDELEIELKDKSKKQSDLVTGMTSFDDYIKLRNGNTYVIGASTGIGKSSFTIDLALRIAQCNLDSKALIYALEMDSKDVYRKMISNLSLIPDVKLRDKNYNDQEAKLIFDNLNLLRNVFDINVQDEYGIDIDVLVNQVTLEKLKNNISYVIIDQISLITTKRGHKDERAKLKEISWKLRKLSGELNIPIIIVTQLNRGSESERASMKHVAESFDIVRDTSALILLDTDREVFSEVKQYYLNIEKNRFGRTGRIPLMGKLSISKFEEGTVEDGDNPTW